MNVNVCIENLVFVNIAGEKVLKFLCTPAIPNKMRNQTMGPSEGLPCPCKSPEQTIKKYVRRETPLWNLASILYYAITKQYPFGDKHEYVSNLKTFSQNPNIYPDITGNSLYIQFAEIIKLIKVGHQFKESLRGKAEGWLANPIFAKYKSIFNDKKTRQRFFNRRCSNEVMEMEI